LKSKKGEIVDVQADAVEDGLLNTFPDSKRGFRVGRWENWGGGKDAPASNFSADYWRKKSQGGGLLSDDLEKLT